MISRYWLLAIVVFAVLLPAVSGNSNPIPTPDPNSTRIMANETIQTIPIPRFVNITDGLIGGNVQSTQTPDWGPSILGIVSVYPDYLGPFALILMFGMPFFMIWVAHGNMKLLGILGLLVGIFVFAYLPSNYMLASVIMMIISFAGLIWGLFRQ